MIVTSTRSERSVAKMRFTVTVRTLKGWRFELEVEDTDTVESLKLRIKEKDGVPPGRPEIAVAA